MRYYIGIDGGGSKTDFICVDEAGRKVSEFRARGTYYRQLGTSAVIDTLQYGIQAVTKDIGDESTISAISFGMPGYGEGGEEDDEFSVALKAFFAPIPVYICNDVAMAFHGAFAGGNGILLVAGTGSMAWGRDSLGKEIRCGGWSHLFGDEGSGYWVGKRALELFSKESDGRLPKTRLYELIKENMGVQSEDDFAVISKAEALFSSRADVAALHRVLLVAAEEGDAIAKSVYSEAVNELALIISAMIQKMSFKSTVPVSYVGGMFNCRDLILNPLKAKVTEAFDADFHSPLLDPCRGAVLYAASQAGDTFACKKLYKGMLREESKYA